MEKKEGRTADLTEYFTPMEAPPKPPKPANKVTLLEYKAPTPSRSFSEISRIEKIVDPLDPLVFSQLTLTCSISYPLIDINDESAERRIDADYIPSYSNLATSESDISAVTTMSEETRSKLRSGCLSGRSLDTVQRYSEGIIRRPSQRRASIHAKANIRDQLTSDQDKKDASYNGGETRQDTPQVSPSIPLDPGTPVGGGGWQRPFVPTNELVLTRPVFHINGDNELDDMVRRFNSSAATSTASVIRAPLQDLQYGYRPARRSVLRPALKPKPTGQSAYPPSHGLKTWRKFPDSPMKEVQAVKPPAGDTADAGNGNDGANKVGRGQIVIEISPSPTPTSPTSTSSLEIQYIGTKSN